LAGMNRCSAVQAVLSGMMQGRTIFLDNMDPRHETNHYRVGEDSLFKLDMDGNRYQRGAGRALYIK
jgi:hypothetical protein